ncbi:phage major capsid protein [Actinocorallia sp. A-T 12471]|uniref:phage major capsid protein n=1 Tax=Actinocorallia sp. A-T 12471 TaxID=3089813 RepID=UPI0029D223B0|nr:phage major capsid protein [Actinocorallia sp. A-T 12471]MDX6738610.1 phage major capsid protein [Actinocorallia sp. A-T 12471]
MKPEIRQIFDAAKADGNRGLNEKEIAAVISGAPKGMTKRTLDLVNAVQPRLPEGRDVLNTALSAEDGARAMMDAFKKFGDSMYTQQGIAALNQRDTLSSELWSVAANRDISSESAVKRVYELAEDIRDLSEQAQGAFERAKGEAEAPVYGAKLAELQRSARQGQPGPIGEWRGLIPSLTEYRMVSEGVPSDGGYTVPSSMAGHYIDALKQRSTFLRGIPGANVIPFETALFEVPQLIGTSGGDYVAEGQTIPTGDMVWGSVKFEPKKIGEIQWASNEVLEDSAIDMRRVIGDNMFRDASLKFDKDAFTGSGTNPIKGILGQGITTTLSAGSTVITFDDLADAVARIEAVNGVPSVIWAAPDVAAALRKEKASGTGTYQAGSPTDSPKTTAWGLPILPTSFIPAKTAIVADGSRINVGIRKNAQVRISEDARFDSDQVGFRLTMRVAGASVAEAESVQVVKAT